MESIAAYEAIIRLGVFAGVLAIMAGLEVVIPRKERALPRGPFRGGRWFTNLSLVIIDTIVLRLFIPMTAIAMAQWAATNGWGIFNWISFPIWFEIVLGIFLLDMLIYVQHVATHKIPILWAIHKVHHADRDFDVTTGVRFHPIEILLSMVYKLTLILVLGPAALAVFIFEVLLNASAMFNHANVKLPLDVDRFVRCFVVTPDMHRVHHSIVREETDSNYGFCLSLWDRLFQTYRDQPAAGHDEMVIGLPDYQSRSPASLLWSLKLPFLNKETMIEKREKP